MTAVVLLCAVTPILYFMPAASVWVALGLGLATVAYFFVSRLIGGQQVRQKQPRSWQNFFSLLGIFIIMLLTFAVLFAYNVGSVMTIVLMTALIFTLVVNFLTVPMAVVHRMREDRSILSPLSYYPKVSIIVPAYNEEVLLGRTVENLIEADYPDKEIIVVDDGSTDRTYEVAMRYQSHGVKAVTRPNGGKFAALNHGLCFATGEIVITVDADSLIARAAIKEIVRGFADPEVAGVAGNLSVFNRHNLITRLQALEYIVQIQVIRRAFENFGTLTVASGAFSAFRRDAMAECGNYDPDRLLEDFDLTIKLLKSRRLLQGSREALCYTEAPETIGDVCRQRLSWYRGDFQNFWKHRDAFFNPRFGFMHRLTFPYMLLSMTLLPFASIIVIATSVVMLLNGQGMTLLYAFGLFVIMQFLLSALAIQIAQEDMKLVIYSPLYIVGYKHLLDLLMIIALFDIIIGRGQYLKRERVRRIGELRQAEARQ